VQRRTILETLLRRHDHPTAEQIYESVKDHIPQLSRTTVYRVLDAFAELGLVRRLDHTGSARFDGNVRRHHHLVCTRCRRIIDLEDQRLDRLPLPHRTIEGFEVDDFSIHFSGTCADCRERKE